MCNGIMLVTGNLRNYGIYRYEYITHRGPDLKRNSAFVSQSSNSRSMNNRQTRYRAKITTNRRPVKRLTKIYVGPRTAKDCG